jgi:hypothetical protein
VLSPAVELEYRLRKHTAALLRGQVVQGLMDIAWARRAAGIVLYQR